MYNANILDPGLGCKKAQTKRGKVGREERSLRVKYHFVADHPENRPERKKEAPSLSRAFPDCRPPGRPARLPSQLASRPVTWQQSHDLERGVSPDDPNSPTPPFTSSFLASWTLLSLAETALSLEGLSANAGNDQMTLPPSISLSNFSSFAWNTFS